MLLKSVLSEQFKLFNFLAVSRSSMQDFGSGNYCQPSHSLVNRGGRPERLKNF